MRIDDDSSGLGAPLHENQTVTEAGMTQGQRIVVEPGQAPLSSEVRLKTFKFFTDNPPKSRKIFPTQLIAFLTPKLVFFVL